MAKDWPFIVVGSLVVKDNKIFLVKEARTEAGKWNQPAGWLEKYENPVLGARRETEEETGHKVKVIRFLGIYSLDRRKIKGWIERKPIDLHAIKLIFVAKVIGKGKKADPKEIKEGRWFSLKEVSDLRKNKLLRDPDIINEFKDYLAGKGYDFSKLIHHARY